MEAKGAVEIAAGLIDVAVIEFELSGDKVRRSAQVCISFAFKFRNRVGVDLAVLDNFVRKVALVRETVSGHESGQVGGILCAPEDAVRGHAAGFYVIHRTLGNGISVVADFVFIAIAVFADMVGEDGAAILQMDRVRRGRRGGEHNHHAAD